MQDDEIPKSVLKMRQEKERREVEEQKEREKKKIKKDKSRGVSQKVNKISNIIPEKKL